MNAAISFFDASEEKKKFLIGLFILCFTGFLVEFFIHTLSLEHPQKDALLTGFTYGIFLFSPFIHFMRIRKEFKEFIVLSNIQFFVIAFITFLIDSNLKKLLMPLLFFISLFLIVWILKDHPALCEKLSVKKPENFIFILYGISLGFFLGAHLVFSATLTQKYVVHILTSRLFYGVCFSFGINAPMEEIFYRGFVFKKLFEKGFSFWSAAAISSFLSALRFCSNPLFTSTPVAIIGVFFYITLTQMLYCALFRFSRSLLPSYLCNAVFGSAFYLLSAV